MRFYHCINCGFRGDFHKQALEECDVCGYEPSGMAEIDAEEYNEKMEIWDKYPEERTYFNNLRKNKYKMKHEREKKYSRRK